LSNKPLNSVLQWVEPGDGCLRLTLDTLLYPETAIFRTCYLFTDRTYIYLRTARPKEIVVEFRAKRGKEDLDSVVGEFGNELINQRIRLELSSETQQIREMIVAQAFSEANFDGGN
jgi:His-Xaa-Ser system protein HxsD